jgi:SPFH domain / Band 7 family
MKLKIILALSLVVSYALVSSIVLNNNSFDTTEQSMKQLDDDSGNITQGLKNEHMIRNNLYSLGWIGIIMTVIAIFYKDVKKYFALSSMVALLFCTGCWKPFEPVKLEVISANEEAFLLPYLGDTKKQTSSDNEKYLSENLVYTKQVKLPQQWVQKGYDYIWPNGAWQDAAVLIKVDKSPITREWTADPNSGTSNRNEAIWVMTSDQVEFSTGWTITARISSRDDAVRFLHNYPNGSLEKVLDTEVRSKIQTTFGLEVTDLPMETLRKSATPHIEKTVKSVIDFFKDRGITITNLGISGGFVYKDPTIMTTLVAVFNAEQQKSITAAKNMAQEETNKMNLSIQKTEADGIKMVADAKLYEMEKAAERLPAYISLKKIELQKELIESWDGTYPKTFMSSGNQGPDMLLQLPMVE